MRFGLGKWKLNSALWALVCAAFVSVLICRPAFAQKPAQSKAKPLPEPICSPHLAYGQDNLPIKYFGNSFSGKFHRPSCPFAQAMDPRHVIFFHFRRQAVEAGQIPCRYCLPPYWRVVKARILPAKKD